ncbi:MAG TPA: PQQ-dependent sugar dehydrogenase [Dehalococcoidia bacterium]|nr:PQQ-dependent sugar dehydrogenase [Dehalococcoidia bacterium]
MSLKIRALTPIVLGASLVLGACGDDDADDGPTLTPTTTTTESGSPGTPTVSQSSDPTGAVTEAPLPPQENGYRLEAVLSADYLGGAVGPAIALALVPEEDNAAIVALQNGLMYRVALDGSEAPALWGDVQHLMPNVGLDSLGEQGLLSLAFSPNFTNDGRVYLYYTRGSPSPSVLSRFEATMKALDVESEEVLIEFPQFAANHNGGHIVFDADGNLLLSLGDGGGGGDPQGNGQNTNTMLGSVIRIDVSPGSGYEIPPNNPFGNEIFAYGLRNPWRMSVDSQTGDIWLGDVGQGQYEEVDRIVAGGNYGWNCYEAFVQYEFTDACVNESFVEPRAAYSHESGVAVTGGFVYPGSALPELYGWYVYGDFYSGILWAANTADSSDPVLLTEEGVNIASFTELPDGGLLIVSYSDGIFRLARD